MMIKSLMMCSFFLQASPPVPAQRTLSRAQSRIASMYIVYIIYLVLSNVLQAEISGNVHGISFIIFLSTGGY